jgi:hypothetical protein
VPLTQGTTSRTAAAGQDVSARCNVHAPPTASAGVEGMHPPSMTLPQTRASSGDWSAAVGGGTAPAAVVGSHRHHSPSIGISP